MNITLEQAKAILDNIHPDSVMANCMTEKDIMQEVLGSGTVKDFIVTMTYIEEAHIEEAMAFDMSDKRRKKIYAEVEEIVKRNTDVIKEILGGLHETN